MAQFGLSEGIVTDVFNHGSQVKSNMMVKKFSGYEVGLLFGRHRETGQYMVTTVWKRDNRR